MPTHTVTNNATGEQHHVVCTDAPGSHLLDKDCMHGSALDARKGFSTFEAEFHPHVGLYMRSIHSFSSVDDNSGSESVLSILNWTLRFWSNESRRDLLRRDNNGEISASYWSVAVGSSCSEQGGSWYSRLAVIASKVTSYFRDHPEASAGESFQVLKDELVPSISTNDGLYIYMHEKGVCSCMQYVAAAARDGTYEETPMHAKPLCGGCKKSVDVTKRCSRCKIASYCSRDCQAKDWKRHKKVCQAL
mmetsp:Transcript_3515/g.5292  ORF Transcript_3515/g.5292 Transcript_3515/m.5292 type:complete len:247 (-) Transcript_3515:69-809(-)